MNIPIHTISLGCPKNLVDTEYLLGGLPGLALPVDTPEDARVVLVNTCGFIRPAVEESLAEILDAAKAIRDLTPKPLLVVAGCLVSRYGEADLKAGLPEVDLWITTHQLPDWPSMIARALAGATPPSGANISAAADTAAPAVTPGSTALAPAVGTVVGPSTATTAGSAPETPKRLLSSPPSYAYLKISEGCRHACRFCTIPSIRGKLKSRPADEIVQEAATVLASGRKELILVAQDLTAFGHDLSPKQGLAQLLDGLLPLPGLERLRLLYLYPAGLTKKLLTHLRQAGPKLMPYFDIPLQHAHPDILDGMGRPFANDPRKVIDLVRSVFPEAAIRTSLIVGYPGETKRHFNFLLNFVEEVGFQHLGVFAYQAEDGTPAAALPGQVRPGERQARREAVMELQADISKKWLAGFKGKELDILVDAPHAEWPGLHVGRAWFQAPDIDGVTYVSGPGVEPGALVRATVEGTKTYDLVALA